MTYSRVKLEEIERRKATNISLDKLFEEHDIKCFKHGKQSKDMKAFCMIKKKQS